MTHPVSQGGEVHTVIVKYQNRKFYRPDTRSYSTLREVRELVTAGQAVKLRDHKTKNDITEQVVKKALALNEGKES
jgi:polyhydroxyalkanoate synthesis regulator protein